MMQIHSFLDTTTETFTHVLVDETTQQCAIIDPVLDFDPSAGRISHENANNLIAFIEQQALTLVYIIETHAHADHLSSAPYLKAKLGGQIVIGKSIDSVQKTFKSIYDLSSQFKTDASQFDILTEEGSTLSLGSLIITAMHMPGHTPADMVYWVDDGQRKAVFVGDTLFAPDVGTARCDFPNGSSSDLYDSIQRLLSLPDDTLLYLCHDYPPKNGRQHAPTTTVADEKQRNIHVKHGTSKAEFIQMRETRDKDLPMPRLILPSVQVNINAGELPNAHANGIKYLSIPLNQF